MRLLRSLALAVLAGVLLTLAFPDFNIWPLAIAAIVVLWFALGRCGAWAGVLIGWVFGTVFMLPHAAATLGFGWAGDRYDRRRVIAVGMAIAGAAGLLSAIGSSYGMLAVSRALVGFGTAAVVPVANSILGQIFEGPHKASRLAVFNLGLFVGGVVGFGITPWFASCSRISGL